MQSLKFFMSVDWQRAISVLENMLLKRNLDWLAIIIVSLAKRNVLNEELHNWQWAPNTSRMILTIGTSSEDWSKHFCTILNIGEKCSNFPKPLPGGTYNNDPYQDLVELCSTVLSILPALMSRSNRQLILHSFMLAFLKLRPSTGCHFTLTILRYFGKLIWTMLLEFTRTSP